VFLPKLHPFSQAQEDYVESAILGFGIHGFLHSQGVLEPIHHEYMRVTCSRKKLKYKSNKEFPVSNTLDLRVMK
jgi:hypothetical protein